MHVYQIVLSTPPADEPLFPPYVYTTAKKAYEALPNVCGATIGNIQPDGLQSLAQVQKALRKHGRYAIYGTHFDNHLAWASIVRRTIY